MSPPTRTDQETIQETGQVPTIKNLTTATRDKIPTTKAVEVDQTQGQTTGMLTKNTQVGLTPEVEITLGITPETDIILQADTNPEIDITLATDIILQVDTSPEIDTTPETDKAAQIGGHLVDTGLSHLTTKGMTRIIDPTTSRTEMTAETGTILSLEIDTDRTPEAEIGLTPLTDPDIQLQVQHLENAT